MLNSPHVMAYVIKRYSNRKLYDTQESRYVTLEEIEEMIRAGKEIAVVDAASGEDLTSVTLAQIILENERNHRAALPTAFLLHSGQTVKTMPAFMYALMAFLGVVFTLIGSYIGERIQMGPPPKPAE